MGGHGMKVDIKDAKDWGETPKLDIGNCLENNCEEKATKDYNGHKHYVCDYHYRKLNDEFDEDYR